MNLKAYARVLVYYAIICAVSLAALALILDSSLPAVWDGWTGLGVSVLAGIGAVAIEACGDERRRRRERRERRKAKAEQINQQRRYLDD